jgi:hypothetical protein
MDISGVTSKSAPEAAAAARAFLMAARFLSMAPTMQFICAIAIFRVFVMQARLCPSSRRACARRFEEFGRDEEMALF